MQNRIIILMTLCSLGLLTIKPARAQELSLDEIALKIENSMSTRDLKSFISIYADSVYYQDPIWGSAAFFKRAVIEQMFSSVFIPSWNFEVKGMAVDKRRSSIMIRGLSTDPHGKKSDFAVWMKIAEGKIVEQMDFTVYAMKDFVKSPRFKAYFEKEKSKKLN